MKSKAFLAKEAAGSILLSFIAMATEDEDVLLLLDFLLLLDVLLLLLDRFSLELLWSPSKSSKLCSPQDARAIAITRAIRMFIVFVFMVFSYGLKIWVICGYKVEKSNLMMVAEIYWQNSFDF